MSVARSLVRVGGVRSLWTGNGVMCGGYGIEAALQQFFLGILKPAIAKDPNNPTTMEKFLMGGTAGLLAISTVFPNYVFQSRTSVAEPGRFKGYLDLVRTTAKIDGPLRAFYSGYSACAIRKFPEIGANYAVYQILKNTFVEPGKDCTLAQSLVFGAAAGFFRLVMVQAMKNSCFFNSISQKIYLFICD